ncbi:CDP-diacylglycerol--glycerol-3-phosphate 3-phosphatidyltransferase [Oscillospiraceae bacterium WX1]
MKNVPNILSIIRIFLVPAFVMIYFYESGAIKVYAAAVYAVASFTDFLDGYVARKYHLITNLGKILDPVGDKLMTLAALICITISGVIPVWAVVIVLIKELMMLIGGFIIRQKRGGEIPPSNIIGKTSTVVFFVICVTLMLVKDIPEPAATAMISAAILLMLAALFSYTITFIHIMKKRGG